MVAARGAVQTALMRPEQFLENVFTPYRRKILYPIAAVKGYGNENRALDFIAFVRSDAGRKVLDKYGFRRP